MTQQILEEHRKVARELTRLLLYPDPASRDLDVLEVTRRKELLERSLSRALRDSGAEDLHVVRSSSELVRTLPADAAFVDLVRYVDIPAGDEVLGDVLQAGVPRYVGFVVQRDRPVCIVHLGNAAEIDDAAVAFRRAITGDTADLVAGRRLCRLVWEPIAGVLAPGTQSLYLSPDAALTSMPWGCLPGGKDGEPLLVDYSFAVVPSGQFLLEQLLHVRSSGQAQAALLLIGDVAFENDPENLPSAAMQLATRSAVGVPRGTVWRPLPGTKAEVEGIARVAEPYDKVILSGAEANAGRVVSELANARWAHFATHGFFSDAAYRSRTASVDASQFEQLLYGTGISRVSAAARNPLLLSGLVLAGANSSGRSQDGSEREASPGILTAEAISFLPLDNLELAVLSACDTGLGDVAGGEGVLGLQRAFHTAGARNVIASLWQVDDDATAVLMQVFYEKMLLEKHSPLQALREAQLTLYRSPNRVQAARDQRGIDFAKTSKLNTSESHGPTSGATAHPRLWAAFVLSGIGR